MRTLCLQRRSLAGESGATLKLLCDPVSPGFRLSPSPCSGNYLHGVGEVCTNSMHVLQFDHTLSGESHGQHVGAAICSRARREGHE